MKVRKFFRTDCSIIDYIISDLSLNKILDRDKYIMYCIRERMNYLTTEYDKKIDRILTHIIMYYNFDNLPIHFLSKIIHSLSKITNVLSEGFIKLIEK